MAYQMAATADFFHMQSLEHLCSILHYFNWQCARTVPLH